MNPKVNLTCVECGEHRQAGKDLVYCCDGCSSWRISCGTAWIKIVCAVCKRNHEFFHEIAYRELPVITVSKWSTELEPNMLGTSEGEWGGNKHTIDWSK